MALFNHEVPFMFTYVIFFNAKRHGLYSKLRWTNV